MMTPSNAPNSEIAKILAGGSIVLFDAECVLCSANAQFILSNDKAERFYLARLVAPNRYRLFGKRETCWLPAERYRARML